MMEEQFVTVGAYKIKDGLFIGDEFSAKDLEFIEGNKVTRIINCAGYEVKNTFQGKNVLYLTYDWRENNSQKLFTKRNQTG